jgi:hypothetical protein
MRFLLLQKSEKDDFRKNAPTEVKPNDLDAALYDTFLTIKDARGLDAAVRSGVGRLLLRGHDEQSPVLWTVAAAKRKKHHTLCQGGRTGELEHASNALKAILHFLVPNPGHSTSTTSSLTADVTIAGSHDTNMIPIACSVNGLVDIDTDDTWLESFGYNVPILFRATGEPKNRSLEVSAVVRGALLRAKWP